MKRWVDYVFNLSRLGLMGKARVHAEISAQIITLGTLLHTSYLVYNVWIRAAVPYQLYAISLTIIGISVMLFRHGHIRTAQLLFLLVSLWFIAAFAITAPRATNTHLHLISVLLLVFTFFQDVPRVWLYLSSILIATIFIVAALPGLEWLPRRSFSEPATQRYFVINSVLFFTAITFFLRWLLELHRRFESESRALAQRAESKKAELEDVNKSLDRIVYTVTHDLRAPLNRLQGLIDLSEKVPAQEVGEYHTMMRKQIGSMKAYIQDIVEYNRNSKTGIDETQLEVGSLVKEVMDTFASEPVALSLTGDVHCLAQLDPMRCKVVLANVIGNAVKYRDPRKAQPYVKIHITARPADFTISIADNGIGIAREHLDKVFDMFFRATDNLEGTGLGLFIVKETVEKLGGKLHVTSELGAGTTFEITLPR